MQNLPQRNSLVSQTSAYLRQEINRGSWKEWLPSERTLCESLQVSRNTLRAALEQLKRENLVDARHGAGTNTPDLFSNRRVQASRSRMEGIGNGRSSGSASRFGGGD